LPRLRARAQPYGRALWWAITINIVAAEQRRSLSQHLLIEDESHLRPIQVSQLLYDNNNGNNGNENA